MFQSWIYLQFKKNSSILWIDDENVVTPINNVNNETYKFVYFENRIKFTALAATGVVYRKGNKLSIFGDIPSATIFQ